MSIYNSPYRLRPINSAAARGIAPGDSWEIAAVQRVKVVKIYRSGDEDSTPKGKAKRNSERRNSGKEYETLDKWLASDAWRKRKAKRKRGRHRYGKAKRGDKASKGKKNMSLSESNYNKLKALSLRLRGGRCEKRKGSKK